MRSPVEEKMLVAFWGTRGSISTPGRTTEKYGGNTPCVTIENQGTRIVLDAGTGIRNLGIELVREAESRKQLLALHLFLSHTHWDHIQGLPFFQTAYLKDTKVNPKSLRVISPLAFSRCQFSPGGGPVFPGIRPRCAGPDTEPVSTGPSSAGRT